ncbi:methyltransferase [Actinokineospora sp.]|uniref:methyltransferase n=1 Tax=Actinokineospora sp. TaxID=1872133 RepID=UPI004037A0F7
MEHTPTVSAEYADRLRRWHEDAYRDARVEHDQTFDYLGRTLLVPPQVHPITRVSHLLGEAVLAEVRAGDRVLDMGTGSGVNAVLAASKSTDVLAVDINPHALTAARANAEHNGVADRVTVAHSDVFTEVTGRFDLIVFDPPFRWFTPRDHLEAASADPGYQAMNAFFAGARDHLADGGRMLMFFGTSGDLGHLRRSADEHGFTTEVLATTTLDKDGWTVEYFTFRLTP